MALERSCAVTAVALSEQRREGARLVTGTRRNFGLNAALTHVHVPYPAAQEWTRRTLTCGVALQCSPSKDRLTEYRLNELSERELRALVLRRSRRRHRMDRGTLAGVAHGTGRILPDVDAAAEGTDAHEMLHRAIAMARTSHSLSIHPLFGTLPLAHTMPQGLADKLRRSFGRMPWTTTQKRLPRAYSVPVGGDGGVRDPNLPPPSRPEDDDIEVTPEHRLGIPYPEWNMWSDRFLPDHVAVLERVDAHSTATTAGRARPAAGSRSTPTGRDGRPRGRHRPRRRPLRRPLHRRPPARR